MKRVAVILAVLTVSLLAASPAAAVRSEYFGIASAPPLDQRDLQELANFRVRTDRFILQWRTAQPTQGPINWTPTDTFVGRLASRGMRPFPFVWGSPNWVTPGPSRPPVGNAFDENAWKNFLKAAVSRYGPGGSYWTTVYQQQFPGKAALPIQHWQVWNEPNLKKYFDPGGQGAQKYARLVQISREAIKSRDPAAKIVLGGMLGLGDPKAWDFLNQLYKVPGFKANFDVAAIHPYTSTLGGFRTQILQLRGVMTSKGDAATPVWLTEFGWGSAPPDSYGINKGLQGQGQMLYDSFNMLLANRNAWNVQRLYWFLWRDPPPGSAYARLCSFCGSGGLLRANRSKKPSFWRFASFVSETSPPTVGITGGPAQGGFTKDPTPTFAFNSSEPGSTFLCHFDAQPFAGCYPPFTRATPLPDGSHTFSVRAIDAPGNESAVVSRTFTVDTHAPATPQITGTTPASPANNNAPKVRGNAEPSSKVYLYKTAGCTGAAVTWGWAGTFASPGLTGPVADNTTTAFRVRAIDQAGNPSGCSAPRTYVEDSTP